MKDKYYFLSTGRTGTTLLSNRISTSLKINVSHQKKYSRRINILGNLAFLNKKIRNVANEEIIKKFGSNGLPLSTTDPLRSIPIYFYLKKQEDENSYKVIHLVRDPRSFVISFMNWKSSSFKKTFLHHCIPFWQPSPIFDNNISIFDRVLMNKFEHFCWVWNFKNRLFKELNDGKVNYFLLRFEDLVNPGKNEETLIELSNFMGIDIVLEKDDISASKKVNSSSKKYFPEWKAWTKEQAQTLHHHCGELMDEYRYGDEDEWRRLIE